MSFLVTSLTYGALVSIPFVILTVLLVEFYGRGPEVPLRSILWSVGLAPLLVVGLFGSGVIISLATFQGPGAPIGVGILMLSGTGVLIMNLAVSVVLALVRTEFLARIRERSFRDETIMVLVGVGLVSLVFVFVLLLNA